MPSPDANEADASANTPAVQDPIRKQKVTPWKVLLPILILVGAIGLGRVVKNSKPTPDTKAPPARFVAVEAISVQPEDMRLSVESQGTVRARTTTRLTSEVSGRVDSVSPNFRDGAIIKQGEMLIQIDPVDYQAALANAQANLAQAKLNLAQEEALSEQAAADWKDLGRGEPTELALRKPQLEQAKAMIDSAKAALTRAERNLERTTLNAPYDGRVVEQGVDVGQFVGANSPLGTIYATDVVEVFLPLSDLELSRLELPSDMSSGSSSDGPQVVLSTDYGGRVYTWQGQVVRTGAAFDSRSRMLDVVVEVADPLAADADQPGRPVLKPGKFVRADIEGRKVDHAFVIPRSALREGDTVLIAMADDTLTRRKVMVIQADTEHAVIGDGLKPGDRVITSPIEYVIEGMKLKVEQAS